LSDRSVSSVQALNATKLSHVVFSFLTITNASSTNPVCDLPAGSANLLNALLALKSQNPSLKVLAALGGGSEASAVLGTAIQTATQRANLASSCMSKVVNFYGLDGLDVDYEFPTNAAETASLTAFVSAIKTEYAKYAKKYVLSAAIPGSNYYLQFYDVKGMAPNLDYIFVMAYDLYLGWYGAAYHNAPQLCQAGQVDCAQNAMARFSALLPNNKNKLILGMPMYANSYSNIATGASHGLNTAFSTNPQSVLSQVAYRTLRSAGTLGTNGSTAGNGYTRYWDGVASVPYLYNPNNSGANFIGFDDVQAVTNKTRWAVGQGYGGVGFWELTQDYNAELLNAANAAL
jgi:chitinase